MILKSKDNYLVTVENKYTEEIILSNGNKLFVDPNWHPEQHTTVIGTIASIPKNNSLNLSIGDKIFFSYVVIGQRDYTSVGEVFHSMFEGDNQYFQRYKNGKMETLTIVAMPGIIGKIWVGTHLSKTGELISGSQGSEHEVDRWKSQFTIGSGGGFKYKNLLNLDGKEYWIIKPELIFAQKLGKKLKPLGDRLILDPIKVSVPNEVQSEMGIKIPNSLLYAQYYDRAEMTHYDKETKLCKGDIIGFEPKYIEKYEVDQKQYYLLRRRRLLGTYSKFQIKI